MQYEYSVRRGALLDGSPSTDLFDFYVDALTDRNAKVVSGPSLEGNAFVSDLPTRQLPSKLQQLVPESIIREHSVIPLESDGRRVIFAAVNAEDIGLTDKLRFGLNMDVLLLPAPKQEILTAISRFYGDHAAESVDSMLYEFTETAIDFGEDSVKSSPAPRQRQSHRQRTHYLSADGSEPFSTQSSASTTRRYLRGGAGMFYYTIEDGHRVLMTEVDGTVSLITGPRRVWRGRRSFDWMVHHVAHPGEFLVVKFRDGHEEHLSGPAEIWFDRRVHESITKQDCLQIAAKEAVVAYRHARGSDQQSTRRIIYGPALFTPEPGEWLHTFSWHASEGGSQGMKKVPHGLVFQKLWLMPDQMYHDVSDVRTADDAVLTIRLMIFFELIDIEKMLHNSHDPIGDFVNAATADVVEFTGKHNFETFKQNTDKLNDLATYKTLISRSAQSGYRIHNVVYRGYGAADSLQQMHNQAIEARTKLQLERATEEQAQELENFKLESQMARADKRRVEQTAETRHLVELTKEKADAELKLREQQVDSQRRQNLADSQAKAESERVLHLEQQEFFDQLKQLGVDLTAYLTQYRADNVIELRGGDVRPHLHLDQVARTTGKAV